MIRGYFESQTEEEWRLLEDLHIVTRLAAQNGVPKSRISAMAAFMAAAAAEQGHYEEIAQQPAESPDVEMRDLQEAMEEKTPAEPSDDPECGQCGEPIAELGGGLGSPACPECGATIVDEDIIDEVLDR